MSTSSCRTTNYPDRAAARQVSRRMRLMSRVETHLEFCAACDAWHVVAGDDRLDEVNRKILTMIAQGLRNHEIVRDLGLTTRQVAFRIEVLHRVFNAISRANLVATAIWLNAIEVQPLMPSFTQPTDVTTPTSKGHDHVRSRTAQR